MSIISEAIRLQRPDLNKAKIFPDTESRKTSAPVMSNVVPLVGDSPLAGVLTAETVIAAGEFDRDLIAEVDRFNRTNPISQFLSRRAGWVVLALIGATVCGIAAGSLRGAGTVKAAARNSELDKQVAAADQYIAWQQADLASRQIASATEAATTNHPETPATSPVAATEQLATPSPDPNAVRAALTPVTKTPLQVAAAREGEFIARDATLLPIAPPTQQIVPGPDGLVDGELVANQPSYQALAAAGEVRDQSATYEIADAGEIATPAADDEILYEAAPIPTASAGAPKSSSRSSRHPSTSSASAPEAEAAPEADPYRVEGIFWDKERPMALMGEKIVEVGARVAGAEIVAIDPSAVTLKIDGKTRIIHP